MEIGGTLSISPAANEGIELTVDVTAPDWVQFDRIELYSHAPGREAVNGESNSTWPEGRILAKKVLDPLALPVEAVPGPASRCAACTWSRASCSAPPPTPGSW